MNTKKLMIGVIALSAIIAGSANAGVSKEACEKSDKTIWVENVDNEDGTKGACIPKNACKVDAFKNWCNTEYNNIPIYTATEANFLAKMEFDACYNYGPKVEKVFEQKLGKYIYVGYKALYEHRDYYRVYEFYMPDNTVDGWNKYAGKGFCKILCNMISVNNTFDSKNNTCSSSYYIKDRCENLGGVSNGNNNCIFDSDWCSGHSFPRCK